MTNEPSDATLQPSVEAPAEPAHAAPEPAPEMTENFADILSDFERTRARKQEGDVRQLDGRVISISAEQVFLDIGYKMEGVLPRAAFGSEDVKPGDTVLVSIKGRNEEGYYSLTRHKVAQPRDWTALEEAFAQKIAVVGTVTAVVKGGASVDVGVRAFMPASRSGTRDAAELENLVGTEITCRITKLDVTDEDVVVDRRVVLEEQARVAAQGRFAAMREGDVVTGTVRSLMSYGAFIDIGGVDGLLHVSDMAWSHVSKPEDVLSEGQEIKVRILKIDPETTKISLGLKQLEPEPWAKAQEKYTIGQRITGTVTRLADFGAFVEIEPGIEGLIHVSEMAWNKKVRHPSDVLKQGDLVDSVILAIKSEERRISLGLKQTLADPWAEVPQKYPAGSQVEGPVTKLMKFGAFVQVADGIEGLVHISEIVADRRLNHPSDELHAGQIVKAQVLAIDTEKRQIKLSMKQLIPTSIDEYIAEHKAGDVVSGRVVQETNGRATVELGEGIFGACGTGVGSTGDSPSGSRRATEAPAAHKPQPEPLTSAKADLSSLTSMLQARWKGSAPARTAQPEPLRAGQVRSFRIGRIDAEEKRIELELA
jgi:small subunit ribosomal protein S1